jgi:hypothetical protein
MDSEKRLGAGAGARNDGNDACTNRSMDLDAAEQRQNRDQKDSASHTEHSTECAGPDRDSQKPHKVKYSDHNVIMTSGHHDVNVGFSGSRADLQIQSIFPQLVVQQILNGLVARQILPKGPNNFELIQLSRICRRYS